MRSGPTRFNMSIKGRNSFDTRIKTGKTFRDELWHHVTANFGQQL